MFVLAFVVIGFTFYTTFTQNNDFYLKLHGWGHVVFFRNQIIYEHIVD